VSEHITLFVLTPTLTRTLFLKGYQTGREVDAGGFFFM
jgi:hypothetical protein